MAMKKIPVLMECMAMKENLHGVDMVVDNTEVIAVAEMNMDTETVAAVLQGETMIMKITAAAGDMKIVAIIAIAAVTAIQILTAAMTTMMIWVALIIAAAAVAAGMMIIIHPGKAVKEEWVVNPAN